MANALYNKAKEKFLDAQSVGGTSATAISLLTDTIKIALIDTGTYTFNAADEFYTSISSAVVGTPQTLGTKTVTSGVFDAANGSFPSVSGATVEALVIYKDTGTAGTSSLIAYIDTVASGLPVTPNGGDIDITFNASGIFAI